MDDEMRYWPAPDWHAMGLPTPEEMAAENKLLSLIVDFKLTGITPKLELESPSA